MSSNPSSSENDLELGGTSTEQGPSSPSSPDEAPHDALQRHDSIAASSHASMSSNSTSNSVDDERDNPVSVLIGSVANLCSATLGAGILALPFAFYQAGIVCGLLLLVASAVATSSSIGLLVETCDRYNLSTYEKIVEKGLGRNARKLVEISILIFCCGTAVGYVIAVGDIMERVVPYMTISQKQVAMSAAWCIAMLPLSCLKKMKSLECASSVGIMSIGTLLAAAVVHLVSGDGDSDGGNGSDGVSVSGNLYGYYDDAAKSTSFVSLLGPAGGSWLSVLKACPIFFYAFSCQVNVAQIFDELPRSHGSEKIQTMNRVTTTGVLVCGLLYAGVSLVTLIDFGPSVKPNILSNYDLGAGAQPLLHVAFLGMALAVVMAFPLNVFPARVSLIQMWEEQYKERTTSFASSSPSPSQSQSQSDPEAEDVRQPLLSEETRQNRTGLDYNSDGETDAAATETETETEPLHDVNGVVEEDEFHFAQHAFVTLLLAGMALGLALVVPNISLVFGLLGGSTSSLLGFVVPGLLGLHLDRNRISAWILVICGSTIGVLTTGVTIYSMFRHS